MMGAANDFAGSNGSVAHIMWRRPRRLVRPAILGATALLLLVCVTVNVQVRYALDRQDARQWVVHTRQVIDALYSLQLNVMELESSKRGYLLTHDASYLDQQNLSTQGVRAAANALCDMVAYNPSEEQHAQQVAAAVQAKLREIDIVLQTAQSFGPDAAAAMIQGVGSRILTATLQAEADAMLQVEHHLLDDRQQRADRLWSEGFWESLTLVVFSLISAGLGTVFAIREIGRRREAADASLILREVAERRTRELQESQQALEKAVITAERANKIKARFLATAGHDLRQPLQLLALSLEALEQLSGEAGSKQISRAHLALDILDRAFRQFSDVARLSGAGLPLNRQMVELDPLLIRLAEELRPLAEAKGLRLRLVRTSARAVTDASHLMTILRNLVGNAIRYTERGSILFGVRRRGGRFVIEVHDSGIGIAAHDIDLIFEEFHQVDRGAGGGLGLGLSIVKQTADLLGHSIEVASVPGKGACFAVVMTGPGERTARARGPT
jgi:signal transduction histidine kinase